MQQAEETAAPIVIESITAPTLKEYLQTILVNTAGLIFNKIQSYQSAREKVDKYNLQVANIKSNLTLANNPAAAENLALFFSKISFQTHVLYDSKQLNIIESSQHLAGLLNENQRSAITRLIDTHWGSGGLIVRDSIDTTSHIELNDRLMALGVYILTNFPPNDIEKRSRAELEFLNKLNATLISLYTRSPLLLNKQTADMYFIAKFYLDYRLEKNDAPKLEYALRMFYGSIEWVSKDFIVNNVDEIILIALENGYQVPDGDKHIRTNWHELDEETANLVCTANFVDKIIRDGLAVLSVGIYEPEIEDVKYLLTQLLTRSCEIYLRLADKQQLFLGKKFSDFKSQIYESEFTPEEIIGYKEAAFLLELGDMAENINLAYLITTESSSNNKILANALGTVDNLNDREGRMAYFHKYMSFRIASDRGLLTDADLFMFVRFIYSIQRSNITLKDNDLRRKLSYNIGLLKAYLHMPSHKIIIRMNESWLNNFGTKALHESMRKAKFLVQPEN